jgi:hypothetical protein
LILQDYLLVNPAYTSQTCHKCLSIGDRKGKKFSCSCCGNQCDADYNGAKNIEALGRTINTPRGSGLSCSLKTEVQYFQLSLFDSLGLPKTPVERVADGSSLSLSCIGRITGLNGGLCPTTFPSGQRYTITIAVGEKPESGKR